MFRKFLEEKEKKFYIKTAQDKRQDYKMIKTRIWTQVTMETGNKRRNMGKTFK